MWQSRTEYASVVRLVMMVARCDCERGTTGGDPRSQPHDIHDRSVTNIVLGSTPSQPRRALLVGPTHKIQLDRALALTLPGSMVETDRMAQLDDLLKNLRIFRLLANSFLGTGLRFAKDGFPSLMILKIWKLPDLEEGSTSICVGVKKGAQGFVDHLKDHLKDVIGEEKNLYNTEETEMPESTDDDDRFGIMINLKHVLYVG
ncbi:hypothetical protein NL676_003836 [Syzygium grande]|nr:hypothetical protein NL676_003836 [Syzygium grande]